MATSMTDFLMFAMVAGGAGLVILNWKCLTDGTFCGLMGGACSGQSGNCTYNTCNKASKQFCWQGGGAGGGHVCQTRNDPNDSLSITQGCIDARANFCLNYSPDKKCGGGGCPAGSTWSVSQAKCVPTGGGGGCTPKNTGNCTYDCKGHFCWHGTANTNSGVKSFTYCGTHVGAPLNQGCSEARANFCKQHSPDGKCGGGGCPSGTALNGNGTCSSIGVSDCDTAAKAWLARVLVAFLGRMCNQCGKGPSYDNVLKNYPSILKDMSVANACSTVKLHTSNATFNRLFARAILSIAGAWSIPISGFARGEMSNQQNTGIWRGGPWIAGIQTFLTESRVPKPPFQDSRPGDSYANALEGRYNRWNPYGDNRYAYTLPNSMKVRVS